MSDAIWFYVDRTQQRRGPVDAAEVAAAVRAGDADDASLVWRDGMADWQPLAGFHEELGLPVALLAGPATGAADGSATSPPSPTPAPLSPGGSPSGYPGAAVPAKSNRGCLIAALVVGGFAVLAMAGLAAISIPAYRQYQTRAAVALAVAEARSYQAAVDDFVLNTDRCPRDGSEIALPAPTTPYVGALRAGVAPTGECVIALELQGPELGALAGGEIVLSRGSAGDWHCTSGLPDRTALPADCR